MKSKFKKRIIYSVTIIISLLIISFLGWSMNYYEAEEEAIQVFSSNANKNISINIDKNITISPNKSTNTGLIFYPGGKVEAEAYIPLCEQIAEKGYKVVIVPMPLKLAVFGKGKAEEVIKENEEIENWAIGGHSLGGVMAADYAYNDKENIEGLLLFASYPVEKNDLSNRDIKVTSIWGTNDGVADVAKIKYARKILPKDSVLIGIEGGNHSQFGNYGFQKGDNISTITTKEQQQLVVRYTDELLKEISN